MDNKKAAEAAPKSDSTANDTSASWQRARVIQALRTGPKTTVELREDWGIMSPAPRIFELRNAGHVIVNVPVSAFTADGVKHTGVARYTLLHEVRPGTLTDLSKRDAANDENAEGTV